MKKLFLLSLALLASFSLCWGTATNFHDFVAAGDTIVYIEGTNSSGVTTAAGIVNEYDWAQVSTSNKNATMKRIDPSTGATAASTSNVYGTKLGSGDSYKAIFKVKGVTNVYFYIGGGSSRTGFLDVEPNGESKVVKAVTSSELSNTADVMSYVLDKDKSYTLTAYASGDIFCYAVKFTVATKPSYTITYDKNDENATGTMENSTNTVAACTFGAPDGYKFGSWNSESNGSGDSYKAGDAVSENITLYAQWVENVPDPTATFSNGTYIIGNSALNMAEKFTSNSTGAVTYTLKEASANASITAAGLFSATVAGEYIVVASQAAVPGSYAAISKEATVTVWDYELGDTYVWKQDAAYTGCIDNPKTATTLASYTDITYEGFTGMGRAAKDNTECILTFSIKTAYSAEFGIKSICTYGKFEESAGGQISWDGGDNWEDITAYTEGKKEFDAPAGTRATSFKIKFMGVSKDAGGLWWRNAFVTLEAPHDIIIDGNIENGKVSANVTKAFVGEEVTLGNTPDSGWKLNAYNVFQTGTPSTTVTVTAGKFTMPAYAVTVSGSFVEDSATALDNTEASEIKTVKRLENGMLVIEKDGKTYNVMGQAIR